MSFGRRFRLGRSCRGSFDHRSGDLHPCRRPLILGMGERFTRIAQCGRCSLKSSGRLNPSNKHALFKTGSLRRCRLKQLRNNRSADKRECRKNPFYERRGRGHREFFLIPSGWGAASNIHSGANAISCGPTVGNPQKSSPKTISGRLTLISEKSLLAVHHDLKSASKRVQLCAKLC